MNKLNHKEKKRLLSEKITKNPNTNLYQGEIAIPGC